LAVRPQFIHLSREKGPDGWRGRIVEKTFLGDSARYELDLNNGLRVTARTPLIIQDVEFEIGDQIIANFQRDKILTFSQPEAGLESELSTG